jgi:hypothetical protein
MAMKAMASSAAKKAVGNTSRKVDAKKIEKLERREYALSRMRPAEISNEFDSRASYQEELDRIHVLLKDLRGEWTGDLSAHKRKRKPSSEGTSK